MDFNNKPSDPGRSRTSPRDSKLKSLQAALTALNPHSETYKAMYISNKPQVQPTDITLDKPERKIVEVCNVKDEKNINVKKYKAENRTMLDIVSTTMRYIEETEKTHEMIENARKRRQNTNDIVKKKRRRR